MQTTILHLDLDAFFASVEQLRSPRLRNKPVLVGNGVIASCSYEARKFGCKAGMPIRQALRLCPRAAVLDGDQNAYRCFTDAIWSILREAIPAIDTYLDEAYGDLTGTDYLYEHPRKVGELLKRRIQNEVGLSATVGIASNRMIAKMAGKAAKPDGLAFVPWGEEEAFLSGRPVDDLFGVGPATGERLHEMGIRTIADLRAVPLDLMEAMFGRNGVWLYQRCRGRDTRPVHEREIPVTISRETALAETTSDPATVRGFFQYLLERAMATVRKLGLTAKTVRVKIGYEDGVHEEAGHTLAAPTTVDEEMLAAVDGLLARIWVRRVHLYRLGITLSRFAVDDPQPELFEVLRDERLDRLHRAVDAIRDKFGHAAVVAGASIGLLGRLKQSSYGYVLRTPSLTK